MANSGSEQGSDEPPPRPRQLGDEAELFREYDGPLGRKVQRLLNTSPDIVDDAGNFAWMAFLRYQPDRDRGWRAWLVTVASAKRGGCTPTRLPTSASKSRVMTT